MERKNITRPMVEAFAVAARDILRRDLAAFCGGIHGIIRGVGGRFRDAYNGLLTSIPSCRAFSRERCRAPAEVHV